MVCLPMLLFSPSPPPLFADRDCGLNLPYECSSQNAIYERGSNFGKYIPHTTKNIPESLRALRRNIPELKFSK